MGDDPGVRTVRRGQILEITITREAVANSLDPAAHDALDRAFDQLAENADLRAAILTGSGDRYFCAGQDLKALDAGAPIPLPANGFGGLTGRLRLEKPVIAAVDGLALGGGMELVLACSLAVASTRAEFALSEVLVGMVAAGGGIARLPRRIPPAIAHELILTGRRMSADEAHRWGLISRLVEPGGALAAARSLAESVLAASPTSIRLSLRLMALAEQPPGIAGGDVDSILEELMRSPDTVEALAAFRERRSPHWK